MKAFIAAVVFAFVGALAASFALNTQQQSASSAYTTASARVGEPGHNLIGQN